MSRLIKILLVIAFFTNTVNAETIGVFYDKTVPQFEFAASDIKTALEKKGFVAELKPIADLSVSYANKKIVIALKSNASVLALLAKQGGTITKLDTLGEQAFALRTTKSKQLSYWTIGGDVAGAMYGGLQVAENISFNSLSKSYNEEQEPYIKKRGIKFNIPLDERIGSLDSDGDQDKSTIKDMWDMSFWEEYFDDLARNRYNVMTYWNRHQFPAMIKLADYPDVALADVYDGYGKLVKKMTIDEKITFWQKVMEYAHNRSMDIYYIYTNIYMTGVDGKYGITEDCFNPVTNDYLRKSVKQFLLTYPYVNGIGVTAGEHNVKNMTFDERENWLWKTYAMGIIDAKKEQPGREIRFIHRHWFSSVVDIINHFKAYDGVFEFSFKYAKGHMFSSPNIVFEDFLLKEMPDGIRSWWNVRNDDIFYCRWGDPEFTRDFILGFDKEKTAGYYIGSDGYTWGRVYCSSDPAFNGQTENKKHWYNFMLWGRLGYNPNLSTDVFKNEIKLHFPEVSSDTLFEAWKTASKIIPQTIRFFWRDWDAQWYPEGCKGTRFVTVNDFINGKTMEGNGILNIVDYCKKVVNRQQITEMTPLDVADSLSVFANRTLQLIHTIDSSENAELIQTKNDIRAFAYLGNYYSEKIKGATDLAMSNFTSNPTLQASAVSHLEKALEHWKKYAETLSLQYLPRALARTGTMDWNALTKDVEKDIELAKNKGKYQLDVSFDNMTEGAEFPKGTDFTLTVKVNSTFYIEKVTIKVNGEDLIDDKLAPYVWDAKNTSIFKNIASGAYEFVVTATDNMGHKAEKTIHVLMK
jgi:hypothetical protein